MHQPPSSGDSDSVPPTNPSSSSTARLAVRNTVWLTILSYAGQLIAFSATIILTRLLGPKAFGLLAIGLFWSSLLSLRNKLGLTQAGIRQPELNGELLGTYYLLDLSVTGLSLILGIGIAIVFSQTVYASDPAVSLILVVMLGVDALPALVNPLGLALERELQLSRLTLVYLIAVTISYGLAIILALSGIGLWSLLVMNIVNVSITTLGTYIVCRWRLPQVFRMHWHFSRSMARRLLKQGVPIGLANMGTTNIVNQYDNFLIGTFVSPTILGYYDRAYRLSQWPNVLLTQVLSRVGFVTFARVQNDLPRLTHAMRLSLWVITTLGVPIALVLTFGASEVVEILYGPAWVISSFFLRFLAIYTLFSPFISLASSLAYAVGNIRMTVWITVAQVITILSVATLLTFAFGAIGTVLGVGVTIAVGFAISALYIFKKLPLSVRATFGAPTLAAGIAMIATLLLMNSTGWHELSSGIRLIAISCTSAGLYLISLIAFRPQEMLERVRYVSRTFRGAPTT